MSWPIFKIGSSEIKLAVVGSIPALSAKRKMEKITKDATPPKSPANEKRYDYPAIGKLLHDPEVQTLVQNFGQAQVVRMGQEILHHYRQQQVKKIDLSLLTRVLTQKLRQTTKNPFHPLINGTGVLLHTNLGRAPLDADLMQTIIPTLAHYSNLECGEDGNRRSRLCPLQEIIARSFRLTEQQSSLVVNNNAASLLLIVQSLAEGKEVLISRGELVEIGDGFRLHEILALTGAKLKEVGSTNCTYLRDYERAIGPQTAMILKCHPSNFAQTGFCAEVSTKELSRLAYQHQLPFVYDAGGIAQTDMITHPALSFFFEKETLNNSLLCFSADKLLGATQAGLILGPRSYLSLLAHSPLMRALRPDKFTLYYLAEYFKRMLSTSLARPLSPLQYLQQQTKNDLLQKAGHLANTTSTPLSVVASSASIGGGCMPAKVIESYALDFGSSSAEKLYPLFLQHGLLGYKRQGRFMIDVYALLAEDISACQKIMQQCLPNAN